MPRKQTIVEEFDPARVKPLPGQPRKRFKRIPELAASIRKCGQKTPGIVTLIENDASFDAQLVDGERRLRACKMAGKPFRAEVIDPASDDDIFATSFAANFGKQEHDCIEIAHGLDRLRQGNRTIEDLADICGMSICWVSQHLSLLNLHPQVQAMMVSDSDDPPRLTTSLAITLTSLPEAQQLEISRKITRDEGMSVAKARRMILAYKSASGNRTAYTHNRGRKRSIASVESVLQDMNDRIGIWLDMSSAERAQLIDAVPDSQKKFIAEALADSAGTLSQLSEMIADRIGSRSRR